MKTLIIKAVDDDNWIGGLYYKANIIFMLLKNSWIKANIELIIECNQYSYDFFYKLFPTLTYSIVNNGEKIFSKIYGQLGVKDSNTFVFPTNSFFGKGNRIAWIPDFQHHYYKGYFPSYVRLYRTLKYKWYALTGMPIVLSSEDCLKDFKLFYKTDISNVFVLHFVSYIEPLIKSIKEEKINEVLKKYNIQEKTYVCIMNQFWKHKNHITVFKAISEYVKENPDTNYLFVFTGKMEDYRDPKYIELLKKIIRTNNISKYIRILGFIDRIEQLIIMHKSEYVIQPSLFEGWGTVLEDAKVLDKTVLLSDIPVHREQRHEKAILFEPENYLQLAKLIKLENIKEHKDNINKGITNMHVRAIEYSSAFEMFFKNSDI